MSSPYIGEIRMFAGSFAPAGWAMCQGQLMPISQNDTLFNLIGTTYGGDGQSTFGLPDCQGRVPVHMGTLPGGGTYQIGEKGGTETVTLNTQQIPIHNHPWVASQDTATGTSPASNVLASTIAIKNWSPFPGTASMNALAVTSVGGNQPHENLMPYLCITFIISLFGIFPSQN
jgi:microcystin-dependent protein